MARVDLFHRTWNRVPERSRVLEFSFDMPLETGIEEIMSEAYARRVIPRGTAGTGCFEVQTDRGIYSHVGGKRIDVTTARRARSVVFKTWEELEREEVEGR